MRYKSSICAKDVSNVCFKVSADERIVHIVCDFSNCRGLTVYPYVWFHPLSATCTDPAGIHIPNVGLSVSILCSACISRASKMRFRRKDIGTGKSVISSGIATTNAAYRYSKQT